MSFLSKRFKSEFQVIKVSQDLSFHKTYRCFSKVDQHNYSVYKTYFSSLEEKSHFLKLINVFSKIYHKNVLRYYNTWVEPPKTFRSISNSPDNEHLTEEKAYSSREISNQKPDVNTINLRFYFQTESPAKSLFEYCSDTRKKFFSTQNEVSFIRIILRIYEQLIEGIGELFAVGIRQKNLMDFNNIFLNEKDEIKLGNLKDLEWHPQDSFKEFALQTLKDVEAITYKLFFEENPFFRSGKRSTNRGRNEVLKKIEEFFLKTFKGKNLDELTANMNTFFQEIRRFVKFMAKKQDEIILGSFKYKEENKMEWREKSFSISIGELRCYRDKKDKKPEKIFSLKDFEVKFFQELGMISVKSPLQIGCFIRGESNLETYCLFKKIEEIRVY